jgi:hypothetical protein
MSEVISGFDSFRQNFVIFISTIHAKWYTNLILRYIITVTLSGEQM